MNNNLVTFEQAKSLRNLGFFEFVTHYYTQKGSLRKNTVSVLDFHGIVDIDDLLDNFNTQVRYKAEGIYQTVFSAPTQCQAVEWLRKNKDVWIEVNGWTKQPVNDEVWDYCFQVLVDWETSTEYFRTPREAYSKGLDIALKV